MSDAHAPLADTMINLLLQRIDGLRKLVVAVPVACCTILHFDDTIVNGFDNIPCAFCHHVGYMCVALEGHDIAPHCLEEILDYLSGTMIVILNIGETKECFGWHVGHVISRVGSSIETVHEFGELTVSCRLGKLCLGHPSDRGDAPLVPSNTPPCTCGDAPASAAGRPASGAVAGGGGARAGS